nr:MAG TPA: Troponin I, cardiac muscle (L-PROLINE) II HELIX, CONTRACTILE [Caudoviricetes sp.]
MEKAGVPPAATEGPRRTPVVGHGHGPPAEVPVRRRKSADFGKL